MQEIVISWVMIMAIAINNIDYNDEYNGCKHTKIICVHCAWINEYRINPRSYEHYKIKSRKSLNFFPGLISTTSSVVFISARIDSMFVSSTAVHRYDFHMFTAIIHHFEGLPRSNIITSSQMAS